jgi:NADH:ubiquinone oxidoreductase subunit F (NADH-binding)
LSEQEEDFATLFEASEKAKRIEKGQTIDGTIVAIGPEVALVSVGGNIAGKTLCAFGDAAATPALTTVKHFRKEFEAHIREGRCTVPSDWRAAKMPVAHAH